MIDCPKTHFKLPAIKTLNLEVICYVKSDPHAEDIYLHWHSINNQNETLRDTDVDEGRYRMKIEDTVSDMYISIIKITIVENIVS